MPPWLSSPRRTQMVIHLGLLGLVVITMIPILMMILLSLKSNSEIYDGIWHLPTEFRWEHYAVAGAAIIRYVINSIVICFGAVTGILIFTSLSGYAFARHDFPGKEFLFQAVLLLMMVPAVLTLIPQFLLVKNLGLLNTRWALILPYIATGQMLGIVLCRTFFAQIPKELFEAARMDGASEFQIYRLIVLPLAMPVLATIAIMNTFAIYNDFVWPLIAISDQSIQVFTVALNVFAAESNLKLGPTLAGYVIGCIPLVILILFGMRYFVRGVTSGAMKG